VSDGKSAVLIENDQVRVLELRLQPGESEPMHSHPAYLVCILGPARMRMTSLDGGRREVELAFGQVLYGPSVTHAGENIGTTELHEIIVELRTRP
jgi:quercetin dioxygenase-like cupin family protein